MIPPSIARHLLVHAAVWLLALPGATAVKKSASASNMAVISPWSSSPMAHANNLVHTARALGISLGD